MSQSEERKIKSLEEILEEIITSADEPDVPRYEDQYWQMAIKYTDEIVEQAKRILAICEAEPELLTQKPFLAFGPYLRSEFAEKLSAALLEIEEMIYMYTSASTFDSFETGRYIGSNKKKNIELVAIRMLEKRILIRMPYLPKKYNGGKDICNQMLAAKIFHYKDFPVWQQWRADYYHVFPTGTSNIPKDVDNYEYKRTNDILAYALGSSDNACRFSMSMTTLFTDKITPGTYIDITPKNSENADFLTTDFFEAQN